ncbi:MAG: hypothetical protein ACREAC_32285, partial [Blastocatellia bacterium]
FSPYGMHCWSEYRKRFEREFPEVVRYSAPMEIALTKYASLVVEFHTEGRRKHNAIYRLLMERSRDSDADLTFISFEGGVGEEMRTTWRRVAVPTTHFFDHKAFRIELPRRGECQVDFLGEEEAVLRFEYDSATKKHKRKELKVEGWERKGGLKRKSQKKKSGNKLPHSKKLRLPGRGTPSARGIRYLTATPSPYDSHSTSGSIKALLKQREFVLMRPPARNR